MNLPYVLGILWLFIIIHSEFGIIPDRERDNLQPLRADILAIRVRFLMVSMKVFVINPLD